MVASSTPGGRGRHLPTRTQAAPGVEDDPATHFCRHGLLNDADLSFTLAGEAIFSVKEFQRPLEQAAARYGIQSGSAISAS